MNKLESYTLMKIGELVGSCLTTQCSGEQSRRIDCNFKCSLGSRVSSRPVLSSKVRSGLKTEPATKEINEKAKEKTEKSKSWF